MPKVKVTVQVDPKDLAYLAHMALRNGRQCTKSAIISECIGARVSSIEGPRWKFEDAEVSVEYLKTAGLL